MPGAFEKSLSFGGRNGTGVAMLWQHNPQQPLGVWKSIQETQKGLQVEGQIAINTTLGKDAYELMKIGAIKGLSIGFKLDQDGYEFDEKKKIRKLNTVNLWEISPVTFPANKRAQITRIKSIMETEQNERELEDFLREAGISKHGSQYIVTLNKELMESRKKLSLIQQNEIIYLLRDVSDKSVQKTKIIL